MLIYHKTKGNVYCTQVILGAGKSDVSTGTHIWDKHQENVDKLQDNGDLFVTGATHAGAVYEGMFVSRDSYSNYMEEAMQQVDKLIEQKNAQLAKEFGLDKTPDSNEDEELEVVQAPK